ncbi:hypothetical protein CI238_11685 [Colletotrichum incanum]|uniref:Uncharacterized protein n=1 Tax=Colletotrichum incanum TaxID=1573173 RepID=A0A167DU61_COLIC|nr:hypothetical protein CI238_11685 [Colletotrichum incanum]
MWFFRSPLRRLSTRDYCDGVDGKAFWPGAGDTYYQGSSLLASWFSGRASNYANTTTALWNVWLQDAKYDEKADVGAKPFKSIIYSYHAVTARNFTFNIEGENWWWMPTEVCNQTVVSCIWTVPRDFEGTGNYVVVAVREAAATTSASTATSGPFTIIASSEPSASATATPESTITGTGASLTNVLPVETAIASSAANYGNKISVGALAGLACGSIIILVGLLGLLWFFWRKRRNQKRFAAAAMAQAAGENDGYRKPELDGQAVVIKEKIASELDNKLVHVAELDSQQLWEKGSAPAAFNTEKSNVRLNEAFMAEMTAEWPTEGHGGAGARSELESK